MTRIDSNSVEAVLHADARVVVVRGCRRVGKSHLATALTRALSPEDCQLSCVAAWLPRSTSIGGGTSASAAVAREVTAALRRIRDLHLAWWVIDDAELLVEHASDDAATRIGEAVRYHGLRVVAIRNRYVREEAGFFAAREAALLPQAESMDLGPLPPEFAAALFRGWLGSELDADAGADWLAAWSGGIPGLYQDLASARPRWATLDEPPDPPGGLPAFAERWAESAGIGSGSRPLVARALLDSDLPPAGLLDSEASDALGHLVAVGCVSPDYAMRPASDCAQGRWWRLLLERIAAPPERRMDGVAAALSQDALIDVAELAFRAGQGEAVCEASGVAPDPVDLALALLKVTRWHQVAGHLGPPLEEVLGRLLGRVALSRILRLAGVRFDSSEAAAAMVGRLLLGVGGRA